ncbi:hypothetical protein JTB14_028038 [Gonioctena quinquepunctata]|nr:hypothetical protein JTB14_028038 [Gonioctena quinquepunctata]
MNDGNNDVGLNVGENKTNRMNELEEHEDGQAATYYEANRSHSGRDFVEKRATAIPSCRDLAKMQAGAGPSSADWEVRGPSVRDLAEKVAVDEPNSIDLSVAGPSGVKTKQRSEENKTEKKGNRLTVH